jgi:hypothetical protein
MEASHRDMVHQKLYEWCMNPVVCNRKLPVTFVEFFCKGTPYVSPSHNWYLQIGEFSSK